MFLKKRFVYLTVVTMEIGKINFLLVREWLIFEFNLNMKKHEFKYGFK